MTRLVDWFDVPPGALVRPKDPIEYFRKLRFHQAVGSVRFLEKASYSLRPALGLTLGGVPGVLIAAFIVKSLPNATLRWLVAVVVVYTAWAMLRSARSESRAALLTAQADTAPAP